MCFMLVNIIQSKIIGLEYTSYITYHFQVQTSVLRPNTSESIKIHAFTYSISSQKSNTSNISNPNHSYVKQNMENQGKNQPCDSKLESFTLNSVKRWKTPNQASKMPNLELGLQILASLSFLSLSFSFSLFFFSLSLSKNLTFSLQNSRGKRMGKGGVFGPFHTFSNLFIGSKISRKYPGVKSPKCPYKKK